MTIYTINEHHKTDKIIELTKTNYLLRFYHTHTHITHTRLNTMRYQRYNRMTNHPMMNTLKQKLKDNQTIMEMYLTALKKNLEESKYEITYDGYTTITIKRIGYSGSISLDKRKNTRCVNPPYVLFMKTDPVYDVGIDFTSPQEAASFIQKMICFKST